MRKTKAAMPHKKSLERAVQYVLRNWDKGETLKEISAQFAVDAGNLDRLFRNLTGLPIKRYIDAQTKIKVDTLLKDPAIPGYKIAEMIGMREETFYRWFKRMYGASLREVRGDEKARPHIGGR